MREVLLLPCNNSKNSLSLLTVRPLVASIFIIQQSGIFPTKQTNKSGTAERKILIVFIYYVLLAAISLVAFSLSIKSIDQFIAEVLKYFKCESRGVDPDNHCDKYINSYLKHRQVALISMSHILLGLYPVVNLVYVVNIRELKKLIKKWLLRVKKWLPCWRRRITL